MREPKKITEIWAWVCTEEDGGEGLPAVDVNGHILPLIGADRERIESLRPYAEKVVNELGSAVKLMKFSNMEVIQLIEP